LPLGAICATALRFLSPGLEWSREGQLQGSLFAPNGLSIGSWTS
jgi:hypothetical protein